MDCCIDTGTDDETKVFERMVMMLMMMIMMINFVFRFVRYRHLFETPS